MVRSARFLEDPDLAEARQTASLAGLAISLALVVAGVFLVETLHAKSLQQDCALAGEATCLAPWSAKPPP